MKQGDAAAHMVNSTVAMLAEFFGDHVIWIHDHQDHWTWHHSIFTSGIHQILEDV